MLSSRRRMAFRYLMIGGLALVLVMTLIFVPIFLGGRADNSPIGADVFAQQRSAVGPHLPNFWGPSYHSPMSEPYAEAPGGERQVQYFDKARMEQTTPGGR